MKKSAYIITKPLQYINATNIYDEQIKDCLLIKGFHDFDTFLDSTKKYSTHWGSILIFDTRIKALLHILFRIRRYNKLFIHSDSNLSTRLLLLLLFTIKVFVYEEGYGNYRFLNKTRNYSFIKRHIKTLEFKLLGRDGFGSFIKTSGLYLYYPSVFYHLRPDFNKKIVLRFNTDFLSHINSLAEIKNLFPKELENQLIGQDVIIYLVSWNYNLKYKDYLSNYPNYIKILKPHPHRRIKNEIENDFDIKISNSLPAELLISTLINVARSIVIIHHGSSTLINIHNCKIIDYNIQNGATRTEYDTIRSLIFQVDELKSLVSTKN